MVVSRLMRAQVAESWRRSAAAGVEADTVSTTITLPEVVRLLAWAD